MSYDGEDRRHSGDGFKSDILVKLAKIEGSVELIKTEVTNLAARVEHSNANTKAFKLLIDDDIQNVRIAIQGDESKGIIGLASRIKTLIENLTDHINQDRIAYGIMISILLSVLGWTVYK